MVDLLETRLKVRKLIQKIDSDRELESIKLSRAYSSRDLEFLMLFIDNFLREANRAGATNYSKSLAMNANSEVQLLAEVFVEKEGQYQEGHPFEFRTWLKTTPRQIPVYMQYFPHGDYWNLNTHRIYADEDITESVSLEQVLF